MTESTPARDEIIRAYLYGFPLVFDLDQVLRYTTTGVGANPAAPFNTFSHARALAGPADTFVTINNDTMYSMAQIDLSVGPVALHVPDTAGRYYVLQFVDAWTNNFAYIGHRSTGTAAGDFLLVPPAWNGDAGDVPVVRFPTTVASIVGRWAVDGDDDLAAVHALQDATTLTPLDPDAVPVGLAVPDPQVPERLMFLEKLRVWSQQFAPAPRDVPLQESLAATGITDSGSSPYTSLPPEEVARISAELEAAGDALQDVLTHGSTPEVNGWKLTLHVFDYNLDYFEIGALDEDRFRMADPERRIGERAAAALGGLWGNHAYEAAYIITYVDDAGAQLSRAHSYTLRLDPPPPVSAFWSLTMYSVPEFYLVDNPIDRYSIGDRTPGLVWDDDGALTITISHQRPADPRALANWLPAPEGEFRPVMRMYEPAEAVIDGSYLVPAITRTAE